MKKIVSIPVLFLLIICLTGCKNTNTNTNSSSNSSSTVIFQGQSRNWSMTYSMYILNNTHTKSDFTLKYKGNDINKVGTVEYNVGGTTEGQGGQLNLDNSGKSTISVKMIGGIAKSQSLINVKLAWNNKHELLALVKYPNIIFR